MPFLKDSTEDKKVSKPLKSFEKRAATVSAVDKGKKPVNVQSSNSTVQQTQKPQPFQVTSQPTREYHRTTFKERLARPYPFKRESVKKNI
ncbi:hypothetical protein MA16_Dca029090 [Dendrobium catenatum]|uniref:Uncharacterized protein n=1 Tax=Dendrobium catenatum TaxID=906689 RepID=A0A2I0VE00_9ASPA|nr:hypothetical protein MA16_Dca029090 [Dendrobium catenatum]